MTPQELKKFRNSLLKEIKVLEVELAQIATQNPSVKGDYQAHFHKPDQSDTLDEKAHSITDYEEERAAEQNLELRLREAKETLKKIDEGTYGICEKCSSPIDARRLKAVPMARFCVSCANKKARLV
jgi:DnaK suppressor protein